jgi:hypothetical protein
VGNWVFQARLECPEVVPARAATPWPRRCVDQKNIFCKNPLKNLRVRSGVVAGWQIALIKPPTCRFVVGLADAEATHLLADRDGVGMRPAVEIAAGELAELQREPTRASRSTARSMMRTPFGMTRWPFGPLIVNRPLRQVNDHHPLHIRSGVSPASASVARILRGYFVKPRNIHLVECSIA